MNMADELELILPNERHEAAALEYRREHFAHGERKLHGSALLDRADSYAGWLALVEGNRSETTVFPGWVPATTFFAVRKNDGRIVGMIDVRHRICSPTAGTSATACARRSGAGDMPRKCCAWRCRTAPVSDSTGS